MRGDGRRIDGHEGAVLGHVLKRDVIVCAWKEVRERDRPIRGNAETSRETRASPLDVDPVSVWIDIVAGRPDRDLQGAALYALNGEQNLGRALESDVHIDRGRRRNRAVRGDVVEPDRMPSWSHA
jgi:hypothetical protein